jgi:hypothetical protein
MSETPLAELQRWFAHVIMHPESTAAGLSSAPGAQLTAADRVRPSSRMSPQARLDVYSSAYSARLVECLADDYPALRHALGIEPFAALCRRYIAQHPSSSPSLNELGAQLPGFCEGACHAELARLEWAIVTAIHADDGTPLAASSLAELSPESFSRVALTPSPALQLLTLRYPVDAYYQAYLDRRAPEMPALCPTYVVVRRRAAQVVREPLMAAAAALLSRLVRGEPVAAALEAAASSGMTAEQVSASFQAWFTHGYFVGTVAT